MDEVEQLLDRASTRFERLKGLEEDAIEEFDKIQALFSLLKDEYDTALDDLGDRVDELEEAVDSVEAEAETIKEALPETARQNRFDDVKMTIEEASLPDCITRDEFARKYC